MTLAGDASTRPRPPIPGSLGRVASRLYAAAIGRINRRFDQGRGVVTLDRPVISVGNLSTGGTGKTPTVMHVIRVLREAGHDPCIAMRGYASRTGHPSDEAQEYARALASDQHSVPIIAQPDRVAGLIALFATQRGRSIDRVVLDDGFQHRQIARDLDIVLIDASRSPFEDALLPAGHLREPAWNLSRAHAVIITHAECAHADDVATLRVKVHEVQPRAIIAVARHTWRELVETGPAGDHTRATSFLHQKRLAVACAIGNPLAFFDLAAAHAQRETVLRLALRDHDPYDDATIEALIEQLKQLRPDALLVTEKDWSKLQRVAFDAWPCPVLRPRLELAFDAGGEDIRNLITAVRGSQGARE